MSDTFDPYHRWLGIPPKDLPPNHYRLLALELFESDPEVIRDAAEQRIAHVRTYQLGPHSAFSQKILNELAAAKACLLDTETKAAYDNTLRAAFQKKLANKAGHEEPAPAGDPLAFLQSSSAPPADGTTASEAVQRKPAKAAPSTKRAGRSEPHSWRVLVGSAISGLLAVLLVYFLFPASREKEADQATPGTKLSQAVVAAATTEKPGSVEAERAAARRPFGAPSGPTIAAPEQEPPRPDNAPVQNPEPKPEASPSPPQQTADLPTMQSEEAVGEVRRFTGHTREAMCVAFSPDGRLAASGDEMELFLWDVATGEVKWRANKATLAVEFSEDGQAVYSCGKYRLTEFDVANGTEGNGFDVEENFSREFSKGGQYLATGKNERIQIYDVKNQSVIGSCTEWASASAFTPNSDLLILSGHELRKYSIASLATTSLCRIEQESRIDKMNISPDGGLLVTGSFKSIGGPIGNLPGDNMVRIWDLHTGQELHTLQDHKDWLLSVVFSPDGQQVLSAGGGTPERYYEAAGRTPVLDTGIRLWDVKTGKLLHRFEGHDQQVNCVRFSPDGKYALSASKDTTIRLWRLSKGEIASTTPGGPSVAPAVESVQDARTRLEKALKEAKRPSEFQTVASEAIQAAERTLEAGDVENGKAIATIALAAARSSGDSDLMRRATLLFLRGHPEETTTPAAQPPDAERATTRSTEPVPEADATDTLGKRLSGTKWLNSRNISFEWTTDGKFLHKGIEREWKILDGNRVQIVFGPNHVDTLVFDDGLTSFEQLIKGGPGAFRGKRR